MVGKARRRVYIMGKARKVPNLAGSIWSTIQSTGFNKKYEILLTGFLEEVKV